MKVRKKLIFLVSTTFCLLSCLTSSIDTSSATFVQITDPHFGTKGYLTRISNTVKEINLLEQQIDFVVITGDFLNKGEYDSKYFTEGLTELKKLKYPLHMVAGGRDIVLKSYRIYQKTLEAYKEFIGEPVYVEEYNGYRFIFAYVSTLLLLKEYNGYAPLSDINKILQLRSDIPTILFFHEPPLKHNNFDEWTNEAIDELKRLVNDFNIIGIITGHWHQDALGWINNTPVYVADSVYTPFNGVDVDSSFRIYTIDGKNISYKTLEVQ